MHDLNIYNTESKFIRKYFEASGKDLAKFPTIITTIKYAAV